MDAIQDRVMPAEQLLEQLSADYGSAAKIGFPLFPQAIESSTPLNSSPYAISYDHFLRGETVTCARRATLISSFAEVVSRLPTAGIVPVAAIVGGSYLRLDREPRDLDCVIFYRRSVESRPSVSIQHIQNEFKSVDIDARLVPFDASPTLVLKAAMFFGCLYAVDRASGGSSHGCVLIEFGH